MSWDKMRPGGGSYDPSEGATADMQRVFMRDNADLFEPGGGGFNTGGGSTGAPASNAGGNWAMADMANSDINAASAKHGVPPNLLKAMLMRESSGDWARDGSRVVYLPTRQTSILPYVGILESTAKAWGYDFNAMIGNRPLQLDAMAFGLRKLYDANPSHGWNGVPVTYFSGKPQVTGWADENGITDTYYQQRALADWRTLDGSSPTAGTGTAPSSGAIATTWGSKDFPISQEYGMTDFARGHVGPGGMYAYTGQYNKGGAPIGHAGIDVAMPVGTPVFTPVGGVVSAAGNTGYYRSEGGGATSGEFKLTLDNGDEFIIGHMNSINVAVGQRIAAGTPVGGSGTANGAHVHIEYRKFWGSQGTVTPSGYEALDPRSALGGAPMGGGPQTMPGGNASLFPDGMPDNLYSPFAGARSNTRMSDSDVMFRLMMGDYVPGYG